MIEMDIKSGDVHPKEEQIAKQVANELNKQLQKNIKSSYNGWLVSNNFLKRSIAVTWHYYFVGLFITLPVILFTIAFISFSWYSEEARNAANIEKNRVLDESGFYLDNENLENTEFNILENNSEYSNEINWEWVDIIDVNSLEIE